MKVFVRTLSLMGLLFLISSCELDKITNENIELFDSFRSGEVDATTGIPLTDDEILAQTLNLPMNAFNYANLNLPRHFEGGPVMDADNTPGGNPVTDIGATLGRVLFYDTKLSANNTISCASCHAQESGFSDPDQFSTGFEGGLTGRNSMGLANARYYENGHFFWDERAATLEDQVLMPIQDHVEMGMTLEDLEIKLQAQEYYHILFERVYGDSIVTSDRISLALAQFVRAMLSYQSKYDEGLAELRPGDDRDNFPNFTDMENLGLQLFNTNGCAGCHNGPLQIGIGAQNNGLDATTTDPGLGAITGNMRDEGKFKSPSLRNIAATAPYMHDGRFSSLMEVVEHYNSGVQNHPNLDPRLRNGGPGGPGGPGGMGNNQPRRLNLSDQEKLALVAFLNTLTDEVLMSDEKFSDPFKQE